MSGLCSSVRLSSVECSSAISMKAIDDLLSFPVQGNNLGTNEVQMTLMTFIIPSLGSGNETIIGASWSEPLPSGADGDVVYIIYICFWGEPERAPT